MVFSHYRDKVVFMPKLQVYISCTFEWSHLPSKLKKFEYDCMLQNFDSYKNTDLNLDTVLEMMAVEKE